MGWSAKRSLWTGVVVLTVLVAPTGAQGQTDPPSPPPLEFTDAEPLTLTVDALVAGADVEISSNVTRRIRVRVQLSELGLVDADDRQLLNQQALSVTPSLVLSEAGTGMIRIRKGPGIELGPGNYSGQLTVFNTGVDAVARQTVTVSVSDPEALPAIPRVAAVSITLTRTFPWGDEESSLGGAEVPLRAIPPGTTAAQVALTPGAPLGFVVKEGGIVAVSWNGGLNLVGDDSVVAAGLAVSDLDGPGDYTGEIDLLPTVPEAGTVTVAISVTDLIIWPILVLLAGIGAAYYVKRWTNVRRVNSELQERVSEIVLAYRDAVNRFELKTRSRPQGAYKVTDFEVQAAEIAASIDGLRGLSLDKRAYEGIVASAGKLREIANSWDAFADELNQLQRSIRDADRDARAGEGGLGEWLPTNRPVLLQKSASLLEGRAIPVAAYAKTRAEIAEARRLVVSWHELFKLLRSYWLEIQVIKNHDGPAGELNRAEQQLGSIRNALWRVRSAADFTRFDSREELRAVEDVLLRFRRLVPESSMRAAHSMIEVDPSQHPGSGAALLAAAGAGEGAAKPKEIDWVELASRAVRRRKANDLVVAMLAVAVALLAGLTAFYFGKDFGTPTDYVKAFFWGLGTDAALTALFAVLTQISGPRLRVEATPAALGSAKPGVAGIDATMS